MTDFVRIPPDSSGKKMQTEFHSSIDSHTQAVHLASGIDPVNLQEVDEKGQAFVRYANGVPEFDAFGRTSIGSDRPLFNYVFNEGEIPAPLFSVTETNGTVTPITTNNAGCLLTNDTSATSFTRLTTDTYFTYTPGFSNSLIFTMAIGDTGKANVVRRAGGFDNDYGVFFQFDEQGLAVVLRSTSTYGDRVIRQASFNGDPLDGTGPSELSVDITKDNIYWIDYQWLGAGAVRFGMYANGTKVVLHNEGNFNENFFPYTFRGDFPLAFEQENTGLTGTSSEFRVFCTTVLTTAPEKTVSDLDPRHSHEILSTNTIVDNSPVHFISFRPSETNIAGFDNREAVRLVNMFASAYTTGNTGELLKVTVIANLDISGGTWNAIGPLAEANTDGTYVGNGIAIFSRLLRPNQLLETAPSSDYDIKVVRKADITQPQSLSLVVERIRGTADIDVDLLVNLVCTRN